MNFSTHLVAEIRSRRQQRLELCLRDLKTTMGMEQLQCQSPKLAEKESLSSLL